MRGLIIFCLFVNDVPCLCRIGRPFMYAGDAKVAYRYKLADYDTVLELLKKTCRPLSSGAAHGAVPFLGTNAP